MAKITLKGNEIHTKSELPVGLAPDFTLVKADLSNVSLTEFKGKNVILNIFPSIDTGVCATSVRTFNAHANKLPNTVVLCISKDLPFAHSRFCGTEGLTNVVTASAFRNNDFSDAYGMEIIDGPLAGLLARSVVVINPQGLIIYKELVPEIAQEPNYEAALTAVKQAL